MIHPGSLKAVDCVLCPVCKGDAYEGCEFCDDYGFLHIVDDEYDNWKEEYQPDYSTYLTYLTGHWKYYSQAEEKQIFLPPEKFFDE